MFQSPFLDLADAFLGHAIIPADARKRFAAAVVAQTEAPGNHNAFAIIELSESLLEQPLDFGCYRGTLWRFTTVGH